MENINEVLEAICIGNVAANYLLNTSRVLKAVELFKECLVLLNIIASGNENELYRRIHKAIWSAIFKGYYRIKDLTNVI